MRIYLHIGLPHCGGERLQALLESRRDLLAARGVLYPVAPGRRNHTRLFMAVSDPDHVDPLRWARGHAAPADQARLRASLREELAREIERTGPDVLILSALQLAAALHRDSELERLRDFLGAFSSDIRLVAHLDEPARLLARHYAAQLLDGRLAPLTRDLELFAADSAGTAPEAHLRALAFWDEIDPARNRMPEIQAPPFWLDYTALERQWNAAFGSGALRLRPPVPGPAAPEAELHACFALAPLPEAPPPPPLPDPTPPSAAWLARIRAMNALFDQALAAGRIIPRPLWRRFQEHLHRPGPPIDPGALSALSRRFAPALQDLAARHPSLGNGALSAPPPAPDWQEADPEAGFRATQYFAVFLPQIDKATRADRRSRAAGARATPPPAAPLSAVSAEPAAPAGLPPLAAANYARLAGGRFAPHNRLGQADEETPGAPFPVIPPRTLPEGSSGNVIVACMKNEGPYIVEWVAYHRAIGVDGFIVYTNDCEDGTDEILGRLQEMGILQHRDNNGWKGNSPQQHALNRALKEPLLRDAEWIIHIDVDEFINIRCGNGTIADFLARVPTATNVAMTWRLFGHNGVVRFEDRPVIEQFDRCAPAYCPKPHTVWGFKTMTRNIGAYEKLSCHRPNKLRPEMRDRVLWVNGSGQPMGDAVRERGWRSDLRSVGYDLLQLNHYALRSAESFLIKRQRGRALHVDRSIGLNYWLRMDWSDHRDLTIQRNLKRLRHEMETLLEDRVLAGLHRRAVAWHRSKAEALRENPEFRELLEQALATRLAPLERVAWALALDMES